jgi:ferric-dicitrate binding protein FerR (iron transport regulator)
MLSCRHTRRLHSVPRDARALPARTVQSLRIPLVAMSEPTQPPRRVPGRVPGAPRNHIASHVETEKKKAPVFVIAAVVVILAVAGYFLLHDPNKAGRELGQKLNNPEAHSIPSGKGQVGSVTLPDETVAKLGSESSVKIPVQFNQTVHGVSVLGTAMFTVKPISGKDAMPFRARARNVDVSSMGGSFAMRAYDNEDKDVMVVAREGALTVNPDNKEADTQQLAVGNGIAIDKDGKTRPLTKEETDQAFSWADGNLTLINAPLSKAVMMMDRWYSTVVRMEKGIDSKPVTAVIPLESSKKALDAISTAASVHTVFHGDSLYLADGAPPAVPVGKAAPAKKKKGK